MKNYRIKGAKVRLNATQADAYFLFLKEGILNFYTLVKHDRLQASFLRLRFSN